jgi:hypothetical protein
VEPEAGSSRLEHQLPITALQDQRGWVASETSSREAGEIKLKNNIEFKQFTANLEQLDAMSLKRRAAEDAVKDADSYAFSTRPQRKKMEGPKGLDPVEYLLGEKHSRVRMGSQDEIDGLLIHSNEDKARLVLSDEILEISLADEAEALEAEPIRIFHVQAPSPWVEKVYAGKA